MMICDWKLNPSLVWSTGRTVGLQVPGTENWAAIIVSLMKNKEEFPFGVYLSKSHLFQRSYNSIIYFFVSVSVSDVARDALNCCASTSSLKKVKKKAKEL